MWKIQSQREEPVLVMSGPVAVDRNKLAYFAEQDDAGRWEILRKQDPVGQSTAVNSGAGGKQLGEARQARGQYTVRKVAAGQRLSSARHLCSAEEVKDDIASGEWGRCKKREKEKGRKKPAARAAVF